MRNQQQRGEPDILRHHVIDEQGRWTNPASNSAKRSWQNEDKHVCVIGTCRARSENPKSRLQLLTFQFGLSWDFDIYIRGIYSASDCARKVHEQGVNRGRNDEMNLGAPPDGKSLQLSNLLAV